MGTILSKWVVAVQEPQLPCVTLDCESIDVCLAQFEKSVAGLSVFVLFSEQGMCDHDTRPDSKLLLVRVGRAFGSAPDGVFRKAISSF